MEEYKITRKQLDELHTELTPEWKSTLEKWFPEAFIEKVKAENWYRSGLGGLWFIESVDGSSQKSYGISFDGEWVDSDWRDSYDLQKATEEEVKSALVKEAENRGLVKGANVKGLRTYTGVITGQSVMNDPSGYYFDGSFRLWANLIPNARNILLFENGVWAEIIPSATKMTLEQIEEKLGHKVEIVNQ